MLGDRVFPLHSFVDIRLLPTSATQCREPPAQTSKSEREGKTVGGVHGYKRFLPGNHRAHRELELAPTVFPRLPPDLWFSHGSDSASASCFHVKRTKGGGDRGPSIYIEFLLGPRGPHSLALEAGLEAGVFTAFQKQSPPYERDDFSLTLVSLMVGIVWKAMRVNTGVSQRIVYSGARLLSRTRWCT